MGTSRFSLVPAHGKLRNPIAARPPLTSMRQRYDNQRQVHMYEYATMNEAADAADATRAHAQTTSIFGLDSCTITAS
jgi:hypothetical protein